MDTQIVTVYCICDDILNAIRHYEDPQCQMSDAEVLTTAIVAMQWFSGNFERARKLLKQPQYIPRMLSKSRFIVAYIEFNIWCRQCLAFSESHGKNTTLINATSLIPFQWQFATTIASQEPEFIEKKPTEDTFLAKSVTSMVSKSTYWLLKQVNLSSSF